MKGCLSFFIAFFLCVSAGAQAVPVVRAGKAWGELPAYRIEDSVYLEAKAAARAYGGQLYWFAVRKEVRFSFRNKQASLIEGEDSAVVDGAKIVLPGPMIVRAGQAFVPVGFFTSAEFAALSGMPSRFSAKEGVLSIAPAGSVGPLRWFSHPDKTRVVLSLKDGLRFRVERSSRSAELFVSGGVLDAPETIEIKGPGVSSLRLRQEEKGARLSVFFAGDFSRMETLELKSPRRVVIDVFRGSDLTPPALLPVVSEKAPPTVLPSPVEKSAAPAVAAPLTGALGRPIRIMIDPGHGGKDGGAVGRRGTLEKAMNLESARSLAAVLENDGRFDVRMTRSGDSFVKLGDRSKASNEFKADLFVSIHCNAAPQRSLSGFEVYYLSETASDPEAERLAEFENSVVEMEDEADENDEALPILYGLARMEFLNDSSTLAGSVAQGLSKSTDLTNRGAKQAAFYVLRGANHPAILVEMAFLSNARDELALQSPDERRRIVEGVYKGILEFGRRKEWLRLERE